MINKKQKNFKIVLTDYNKFDIINQSTQEDDTKFTF